MPNTMVHKADLDECINNCMECAAVCTETAQYCLQKGGRYNEAPHIRILLDCADICRASSAFMLRNSEWHPRVCEPCAFICQACAESCEQVATNDSILKDCALLCRKCEDTCAKMAEGAYATEAER
jgi:hypothetical protein